MRTRRAGATGDASPRGHASPAPMRRRAASGAAAAGPAGSVGAAAGAGPVADAAAKSSSRRFALLLLAALCLLPSAVIALRLEDDAARRSVLLCAALSAAAFAGTYVLIPVVATYTLRKGMYGMDLNKRGTPAGAAKVPEALGLAPGVVFLVAAILFQQAGLEVDSDWLVEYNAALASICFMLLLGFIDDVLDVPWRAKIALPAFAALPLLMAYAGGTDVLLPKPLRPLLGLSVLPLGWIYKAYMLLVTIFCTNSINILAGVNGLEAGQSAVLAAGILLHNLTQLALGGPDMPAMARGAQLFSVYLMAPMLAVTLALLCFNWYPSQVFVGDTFTYFAGMALAAAGLLGHFSETLLLFFLPQVINFVYSLPQLLKIVPCPRHRLPALDPATGLLHATPNWNLVNLTLCVCGPLSEPALTATLLAFQAACIGLGFAARYMLAGIYK